MRRLLALAATLLAFTSAHAQRPRFFFNHYVPRPQESEYLPLSGGNLTGPLGINSPSPSSWFQIRPRYPVDTTDADYLMSFTPPNNISDFAFRMESVYYGAGNTDDVMWMGWNPGDRNPMEPSFHEAWEREFNGDFERHMEAHTPEGGNVRYWSWNINRLTGRAIHYQKWSQMTWARPGENSFRVAWDFDNNQITFMPRLATQGGQIWASPGGERWAEMAGSPYGGELFLGTAGNAPSMRPNGFQWLEFRQGAVNATVTANRYYARGATGTVNEGSVLDANSLRLATGSAIYFGSTSNPYGASDVALIRGHVSRLSVIDPRTGLGATLSARQFDTETGYRVGGAQVVGSRCPAIPDAVNTTDAVAKLNALLTCLRTHGLLNP